MAKAEYGKIVAAAFMAIADLAVAMEIDMEAAGLVRREARAYIRARWAYEDALAGKDPNG